MRRESGSAVAEEKKNDEAFLPECGPRLYRRASKRDAEWVGGEQVRCGGIDGYRILARCICLPGVCP